MTIFSKTATLSPREIENPNLQILNLWTKDYAGFVRLLSTSKV